MVIVLLANGFEEIEALAPVDLLRRAGLDVKTVGISGPTAEGAHGIKVSCDASPEQIDLKEVTMAIFPGGMPGATNLDASPFTDRVIEAVTQNGGRLAAICAAPLVFGRRGLLKGKKATCYPGFENELVGAHIADKSVITDGNITTARGMGVATEFGLELISLTCGEDLADDISKSICRKSKIQRKSKKCAKDFNEIVENHVIEQYNGIITDERFCSAVEIALSRGVISTALIQRGLHIGYGRAAKIIDAMEALGIVTPFDGQHPREVNITHEEREHCSSEITKMLKSES